MMDVESYCKNVAFELSEWKDRVDEIVKKFDHASTGEKSPVFSYVNDLHMFMEELSSRIDRLRNECPIAWSREEFEKSPREFHFQKEWKERDISPAEFGG